jgi:hypothetical protein
MKSMSIVFLISTLAALSPPPFRGGDHGIGFDDLGFAPMLRKVMVPGGATGKLALIDPDSQNIEIIGGFTQARSSTGGQGEEITSADACRSFLYITDRSSELVEVLDPHTKKIVASAHLASAPDYVRFVADTNELWVTEPSAQRIEIFALPARGTPVPTYSGFVGVPGGPESLIAGHGRAFTHLWAGTTIGVDIASRKMVSRWPNGCKGSRGLALDEKRGFLFAGCGEGKVSVLDMKSGKVLGKASCGSGVDVIAYNQKRTRISAQRGQRDNCHSRNLVCRSRNGVEDGKNRTGRSLCHCRRPRSGLCVRSCPR